MYIRLFVWISLVLKSFEVIKCSDDENYELQINYKDGKC